MSELRKAAQQALEALEQHGGHLPWGAFVELRKALRTALAQPEPEPEQEPVAWMCPEDPERETAFNWKAGHCENCGKQQVPLYTVPPQRKPLTDDLTRAVSQCNAWWVAEITEIINDNTDGDGICCADDLLAAIRARGSQGIGATND